MSDAEPAPWIKGIGLLMVAASAVFATWCTWVAFVGGTTPILGWHQKGGIGAGLIWLFLIDPILMVACRWLSMFLLMPIAFASGLRRQ